jgi:hypothetical protein
MKIQSRPPIDNTPVLGIPEISTLLKNVLETEGYGAGHETHRIMIRGAVASLSLQKIVNEFYVSIRGLGRHGIQVDFRLHGDEKIYTIDL